MNVGELKAELKHMPDDASVVVCSGLNQKQGYVNYSSPRDAWAYKEGTVPCMRLADLLKNSGIDLSNGVVLVVATDDTPVTSLANEDELPANLKRPVIRLYYADLEKGTSDGLKRECPFCEEGMLLLRRGDDDHLLATDQCIGCGQSVQYMDIDELRSLP